MNSSQPTIFSRILASSRLLALFFGVLMYSAGAGINDFLGGYTDWVNFWLGLGCTTLLQVSAYLLKAYYDWLDPASSFQMSGGDKEIVQTMKTILFQVVMVLLTVDAVLTAMLFVRGAINLSTFFIFGVAFILAFLYATPPLRLVYAGYGELIEAFMVAALIPGLALMFQTGSLHRLLAMMTFPIMGLYLAFLLILDLKEFGRDIKTTNKDLLFRIGWQSGMNFHNILILGVYLLIVGALLLGFPWNLAWPALLTFPIGIFQVIQIIRIAGGSPPRWKILKLVAGALPLIMAYLFIVSLWTH